MREVPIEPNVANYEPICLTGSECHLLAIYINCHLLRNIDCIYFCTILVKHKVIIVSKFKRRFLLIVNLSCFTIFYCKSQNLILNGSFENYSNIDCVYGGFDNYTMTSTPHIVDNWYTLNSSDYFNSACTNTYTGVPSNLFGNNFAKQGNAYVGGIGFCGNYETKEYVYQHLSVPLQAGNVYCLNFYVSRASGITYAIKDFGAYFSVSIPTTNSYINATPQVLNQSGFITDTTSWTQIQGCFTATGGEQYITLGNFNSNANTDTLFVGSLNQTPFTYRYAYYYVDDVSLINQATVGVNNINNTSDFEIYPNPNSGLLKFSNLKQSYGDYNVRILDLFGKEIINEVLKEELDISYFDKGVYTLLLYKNKQLVVTKKLMKD